MTDRLDDVWTTRDFPVLVEVARRVDAGENAPRVGDVAEALGMPVETVQLAGAALARRGLVETRGAMQAQVLRFTNLSGEAYLITGLHPRGEDAIAALVDALRQAEDAVNDPEEKTLLRRAGGAIGSVSQNVMGQVLTAYIRSQTGI